MKFSAGLQNILNRKYSPSTSIHSNFKGNDLAFKTDSEGNPILLFVGKINAEGKIKGERYARTLKYDTEGKVIKVIGN